MTRNGHRTCVDDVNELIAHDPVFRVMLSEDLLNVRKTARYMIKENGWDHSEEAVVSALRRYETFDINKWNYVDEMNSLYEIAESYSTIRSNSSDASVLKDAYEKADEALERLKDLDASRIEIGGLPILSDNNSNNIRLFNDILAISSYFHNEWDDISAEAMLGVLNNILDEGCEWDEFRDAVEEHFSDNNLKKRVDNGKTFLVPTESTLKRIPRDYADSIGHILNETEYVYPPLEKPIKSGAKGIKKRISELEFFPYSLEKSILKSGLVALFAESDKWGLYGDIKEELEKLVPIKRSDMLISRYISELEDRNIVVSRGKIFHRSYHPTEMIIDALSRIESLNDVFDLIETGV